MAAGGATYSEGNFAVRLQAVCKRFAPGVDAVDRVSLQIPAGQFLAMVGPSGCGKSTLLRMIARLEQPTSGDIQTHAAEVAFVFQDAHLLPWRTVLDNAALPLELKGVRRSVRRQQAAAMLEQVGLLDAVDRYPSQLSGGMRMRVSLARALVTQPRLLLLDEPFAALDEITRSQLDLQLHQLWQWHGMTVVFVTHSIAEAVFLAERAVVFTPRPARVILDRVIEIPSDRTDDLRGSPAFAAEMHALLKALRHGEELL